MSVSPSHNNYTAFSNFIETMSKAPPRAFHPRANLPGGEVGAEVSVSGAYQSETGWLESRDELLHLANNLIKMREAKGQLRRENGCKVVIYGILFTYDVGKRDWRGVVVDGVQFIECIAGVMDSTSSIKDIDRNLYLLLTDIHNPPVVQYDQHGKKIYEA